MSNRIAGTFYLKINNKLLHASGDFSYSLGLPKREGMTTSSEGSVGYKEEQTIPHMEGDLIDKNLDQNELSNVTDGTVTLELANGKTFVLSNAYCCGDLKASTDGKITCLLYTSPSPRD